MMTQKTIPDVSDQVLVDYALKLLPHDKQDSLSRRIEDDRELQARLCHWQEILFALNTQTAEVKPPVGAWRQIENQLFKDNNKQREGKRWIHFLIPACIALSLFFFISFQLLSKPNFHAAIFAQNANVIWQIDGKDHSLKFVSVSSMHRPQMKCVAWIKLKNQDQWVNLGKIPDQGGNKAIKLYLPQNLHLSAGDRIVIDMIHFSDDMAFPPKPGKMTKTATLTKV